MICILGPTYFEKICNKEVHKPNLDLLNDFRQMGV